MMQYNFTTPELDAEADRLFKMLASTECDPRQTVPWSWERCKSIAPLTLEINARKKNQQTSIMAHSYVDPEIIYGIADHVGDSFQLSSLAKRNFSPNVLFVGVVFMAESTKLLSPKSRVYVPDIHSGCSLADSLTADQLRTLKRQYPNAAVVS